MVRTTKDQNSPPKKIPKQGLGIKKVKPPSRPKPGMKATVPAKRKSDPVKKKVVPKKMLGEAAELQKKVENLELLLKMSRQFSATLDFKKLMNSIFESVLEILEAEAGSFWLPDNKTKEIICSIAEGPAKDKVLGLRLKEGQGIVGWAMQHKQNAVIFDAVKDERFAQTVDKKTKFISKSMLCVPLLVQDECVGAIQIINKKTEIGQFDQNDLEMLDNIANSAAIAIKNARLYQSEQRIKELNTLLNFSKVLTSSLDLDQVLLSIVNLGSQVINYSRAVVALLDQHDRVVIAAESRQAQPDMSAPENQQLQQIMRWVVSTGSSQYINDFKLEQPPEGIPDMIIDYMKEFELKCLNVIILADSEGRLGLLALEGEEASLVAPKSQYVINMLVNQATVAIRNAQLYQNIPTSHIAEKFKTGMSLNSQARRKIGMFLTLLAFSLFAAIRLPFPANITAEVEVIPLYKSQVTAIEGGVVKEVLFQEGDLVKKGQVLFSLDRSELELEQAKLRNDRQIALSDLQRLLIEDIPADIYLKQLQIDKLENQLLSVQRKLNHTKIRASRGGVILTSKPKELLDKQVNKGEVVVEIAFAGQKAALLLIEEEDILKVHPGAPVSITLQALPGKVFRGELEIIAPIKIDKEDLGKFYGAYIKSPELSKVPLIMFGMTGKAKIHRGQQTIHRLYFKPSLEKLITQLKLLLDT